MLTEKYLQMKLFDSVLFIFSLLVFKTNLQGMYFKYINGSIHKWRNHTYNSGNNI